MSLPPHSIKAEPIGSRNGSFICLDLCRSRMACRRHNCLIQLIWTFVRRKDLAAVCAHSQMPNTQFCQNGRIPVGKIQGNHSACENWLRESGLRRSAKQLSPLPANSSLFLWEVDLRHLMQRQWLHLRQYCPAHCVFAHNNLWQSRWHIFKKNQCLHHQNFGGRDRSCRTTQNSISRTFDYDRRQLRNLVQNRSERIDRPDLGSYNLIVYYINLWLDPGFYDARGSNHLENHVLRLDQKKITEISVWLVKKCLEAAAIAEKIVDFERQIRWKVSQRICTKDMKDDVSSLQAISTSDT
jgi:hypothetical protein